MGINKGSTQEFLYNQITAITTICIEIPAYTLYFVGDVFISKKSEIVAKQFGQWNIFT